MLFNIPSQQCCTRDIAVNFQSICLSINDQYIYSDNCTTPRIEYSHKAILFSWRASFFTECPDVSDMANQICTYSSDLILLYSLPVPQLGPLASWQSQYPPWLCSAQPGWRLSRSHSMAFPLQHVLERTHAKFHLWKEPEIQLQLLQSRQQILHTTVFQVLRWWRHSPMIGLSDLNSGMQ